MAGRTGGWSSPLIRVLRILSFLAAAVFSSGAIAGSADEGVVIQVFSVYNGRLLFSHSGTTHNRPACATSGWAIDGTTPAGQMMVASLLTAIAQGRRISIIGTGACDLWGDSETVYYFNYTAN
jgi:hypothetical protein